MNNRLNGFAAQVRITGEMDNLPAPIRRKANPLGRSRTSAVVTTNHLDGLRADIRATVERVAAQRGVKVTDITVVSPTKAIIP
ncbi:hypothetical protein ABZ905_36735 [Streptomyces parvus]|uniref:hypothetical protein n=1 Tax=Streptomyces parvus TaxID=66428 RepID=UPI00340A5704